MRIVHGYWSLAALAVAAAMGCASTGDPADDPPSDVLTHDDLLVPIPRALDDGAIAQRGAALAHHGMRTAPRNDDFYLAIHRSAFDQLWFWSTYLKEFQPFGPNPFSLGSKVIRFREQNGTLYVFDADRRRATSDVFRPDLILDAFPIVHSDRFNSLPGSGSYVLIDPSAGLNRFNALSDYFGSDPFPILMTIELSFVQGFRAASDGASYEQIVTGYTDIPLEVPDVEFNEYRVAATLGVTLRRYTETPAYREVAAPPQSFYFLAEPRNVRNTGEIEQVASHWGFAPGMQPLRWVIGRDILDLESDPSVGGARLFDAVKAGIESWNAIFGYRVFTAVLAGPNDVLGDDHVNYFIIDPDASKGFAFADWRTNPNTGEIRGASVYMGGGILLPFPDDPPAMGATPAALPRTRLPGLTWLGQRSEPLCVMWGPRWEPEQLTGHDPSALTGRQKLELYARNIAAHEVGHTLGLRHNFKGSLVPPTSTVMEYNLVGPTFARPDPGPYDQQAIDYLYGRSTALPTLPFCTDEGVAVDPSCARFDGPAVAPLTEYHVPRYTNILAQMLAGQFNPSFVGVLLDFYGSQLYNYVRAGTTAEGAIAWEAALRGARPPITPAQAANPTYAFVADATVAYVYRDLFLVPTDEIVTPPRDFATIGLIAGDARNILLNVDGIRTFSTRRIVVDALKRAQSFNAYTTLLDARAALADQLPGAGPSTRALLLDLLARIDAAITPYFD